MNEINNSNLTVQNADLNRSASQVSQPKAPRPRTAAYIKFKNFAKKHRDNGDALVKFVNPNDYENSDLRVANSDDDGGFLKCDKINALYRRDETKAINNNVRNLFIKALVDSFNDIDLFAVLSEKELEDMKLADFIGDDALKAAQQKGKLMLSELAGKATTGKPLSSRRIAAITEALENYDSCKLEPELIDDEDAGKIVGNIFTTWAWPDDDDDGAEACKERLNNIHAQENQGPKPLTINISGSENGLYENAATGEALRTKLFNALGNNNLATGFLLKFLSRVSRFGVDSFLYKSIHTCYEEYRKQKNRYKSPIVVNLKIVDLAEKVEDKGKKGKIVLEVTEGEGNDRRTATATFKLSDYGKFADASLSVDKVDDTPVLKFTSGPSGT